MHKDSMPVAAAHDGHRVIASIEYEHANALKKDERKWDDIETNWCFKFVFLWQSCFLKQIEHTFSSPCTIK
jgi:hypothetical protein